MYYIQTKTANVLTDARSTKKGRIVLELKLSPSVDNYTATINDYKETIIELLDENQVPVLVTKYDFLSSRTIQITAEKINLLYSAVDTMVPTNIPYFEREKQLSSLAFLLYVQNDFMTDENGNEMPGITIYGLSATDWELRTIGI